MPRRRTAVRISCSLSASSADVASSSTRMAGSRTSARAISIRWRWPPLRLRPPSSITVPRKLPGNACDAGRQARIVDGGNQASMVDGVVPQGDIVVDGAAEQPDVLVDEATIFDSRSRPQAGSV